MFRRSLSSILVLLLMAVAVKGDGVADLGIGDNTMASVFPADFMGIPLTNLDSPDTGFYNGVPRAITFNAPGSDEIKFDRGMKHFRTGGGGWSARDHWPDGLDVYFTGPDPNPTQVVMTPPQRTTAFVFSIQPDSATDFTIDVTYENGQTVSFFASFFDGRRQFAAYRSSTAGNPISVTVGTTSTTPKSHFAVGGFSIGTLQLNPTDPVPNPNPGAGGIMDLGIGGPTVAGVFPSGFMGIPLTPLNDPDTRFDGSSSVAVLNAPSTGEIKFDRSMRISRTGDTWSGSGAAWPDDVDLYYTGSDPNPSKVVMTPPAGTTAFVFSLQSDGGTDLTVDVTYENGHTVRFFATFQDGRRQLAAYRSNTDGNPISVTVDSTSTTSNKHFAVGGFSIGTLELNPMDPMTKPDPHFKTFGNEWYDFHGACDLVLMSNPDFGNGAGLDVHIRTVVRYAYSYIQTAAIRVGGELIQISEYGEYVLNSVANAATPYAMAGAYTFRHEKVDKNTDRFHFDLGKGRSFTMQSYKDMLSFSFNLPALDEELANTVGLLGNYKTGERLGRDGVTAIEDPVAFGQEWQVRSDESMLFETHQQPQFPMKCQMPNPQARETRRLRGTISKEAAAAACAHIEDIQIRDMCIFDVTSTEDLSLATSGVY